MCISKKGFRVLAVFLILIAFFFSFSFSEFCLGDTILHYMGLPTWSTQGFHITILYSVAFLFAAILLLNKRAPQ